MLVAIEALIGTGKTTVVEHLDGVKFFEPVDANPFLEMYYAAVWSSLQAGTPEPLPKLTPITKRP